MLLPLVIALDFIFPTSRFIRQLIPCWFGGQIFTFDIFFVFHALRPLGYGPGDTGGGLGSAGKVKLEGHNPHLKAFR